MRVCVRRSHREALASHRHPGWGLLTHTHSTRAHLVNAYDRGLRGATQALQTACVCVCVCVRHPLKGAVLRCFGLLTCFLHILRAVTLIFYQSFHPKSGILKGELSNTLSFSTHTAPHSLDISQHGTLMRF
nr:MAG TPA: hypothetical protein [Caudoviricetes sp.]